jgi:hypothetical protein
MPFLPCFLCGAKLDKRTDKNRKPYFVCNPCGIQLFVRREHGIGLLDKLLRNVEKYEIPFKQRAAQVYQIQALLTEITGIKQQIERLETQTGFFFPDKDKVHACNLLKIKLQNLFRELAAIAKQDAQIKTV